ncbi:MAG: hypothetical protein ACREJ0_13945 [Geminicoccaceae bacterium]
MAARGGMVGVTIFGLVFTPVFYVVARKLARSWAPMRRFFGSCGRTK